MNGNGHLSVDLTSGIPTANTQQQTQATIITPDQSQQTVTLQSTAPEHWEGNFETPQTGTYFIKVLWQAKGNDTTNSSNQLSTETAMVVPYSPEYQTQGTDLRFLKQLAQAGGGIILSQQDPATAFTQTLKPAWALTPVTFWLLILAALLLPIDIAARRLAGLDFITATYRWIQTHLKPASIKQTTDQEQATAPILTPLTSLRAKREQQQKETQHPNPSTPSDSTSRPSETNTTRRDSASRLSAQPPAQTSQETQTKQTASSPKNGATPSSDKTQQKSSTESQDASVMAAKLVEAKRKREQQKE